MKRSKPISLLSFATILFLIINCFHSVAQPQSPYVQIVIQPTGGSWDYKINENADLTVTVLQNNIPLQNISISYEYGLEGMPVEKKGTQQVGNKPEKISIGTLSSPGLKRCVVRATVDNIDYSSMMTVAYSPEQIKATVKDPDDFNSFWNDAIAKMRNSPSVTQKTVLDEYSTVDTEVSLLNFTVPNSEVAIYGYLSKPKKKGKYPILLYLPGAGIGTSNPMINFINKDIITLSIEIHGLNPQADTKFFQEVRRKFITYMYSGVESRDKFYFKPVVLGCIKAADYLCELPQFDGENFITFGGSQGGYLSIATAALDKRVTGVVSFHPAMSDLTGYLDNRVGGWPHYFAPKFNGIYNSEATKTTLSYFDTVNFARRISIPGFYSFGYNDVTCPPTTCFAVTNSIDAPKAIFLTPITGHWRIPEMMTKSKNWVIEQIHSK